MPYPFDQPRGTASKAFSILSFVLIVAMLPVVILLIQQPQTIQQRAAVIVKPPVANFIGKPYTCNACTADIDKNGTVENNDFFTMQQCFEKQTSQSCVNMDFNNNGTVEVADMNCISKMYGEQCTR